MPNKHLIIVVISFFTFAFVYASSFTFDVFAVPPDDRFGGKDTSCESDYNKNTKTCCWRERVPGQILAKTYCQTCDYAGKICKEKVLQFTGPSDLSQFEGNILEEATPPSDQSRFPTKGGLLGLLDETSPTIQSGDNNNIPQKDKGELLGLLDNNLPTFQQQQPLAEFTTPQRNIPNDLLSNLDNDNLLTSVPPEQTERLNLLEDGQDEESHIKETDRDNDENILKDEDKEEEETEEKAEQDNDDTIYCIRAPCPNSNDEQQEEQPDEQPSLNKDDDETQSREDDKQEQEEPKEAELPPIITETLTPE